MPPSRTGTTSRRNSYLNSAPMKLVYAEDFLIMISQLLLLIHIANNLLSPFLFAVSGFYANQRSEGYRINAGCLCQNKGKFYSSSAAEDAREGIHAATNSSSCCVYSAEVHRTNEKSPNHCSVNHLQGCEVHRCSEQGNCSYSAAETFQISFLFHFIHAY